jgi:hypothetical protein
MAVVTINISSSTAFVGGTFYWTVLYWAASVLLVFSDVDNEITWFCGACAIQHRYICTYIYTYIHTHTLFFCMFLMSLLSLLLLFTIG